MIYLSCPSYKHSTLSRRYRHREHRRRLPFCNADQEILCAERGSTRRRTAVARAVQRLPRPHVGCIFQQDSRLAVVGQVRVENFMTHAFPEHLISEPYEHFDPLVQIARHPVCTTHVNLFFAAVGEIEDPTVLEEASHNAAHVDVVAHAADSRTKSTNAANQ